MGCGIIFFKGMQIESVDFLNLFKGEMSTLKTFSGRVCRHVILSYTRSLKLYLSRFVQEEKIG